MTGMDTASMIPVIIAGSDMRATPPALRMSAGTRSRAMTATAPASSAILAWSAVTTSMMTPPLSIWARPRLAVQVPVSGEWPLVVGEVGAMGSTVMAAAAPGVRTNYPYISSVCTDVRLKRIRHWPAQTSTACSCRLRPVGRAVYVDCFSGASGDMLLGALFDAGVSVDDVRAGLLSLPVSGWTLDAETIRSHGLPGTRAKVKLTRPDQPHRGLGEVVRIIRQGSLPPDV